MAILESTLKSSNPPGTKQYDLDSQLYVEGLSELVGEAPLIFEITAVVAIAVAVAEVEVEVELAVGVNVAKVDLERSAEVLSLLSPLLVSVCSGWFEDVVATAESVVGEFVGPSCLCMILPTHASKQKHSSRSNRTLDRIVYTIVTGNRVHGRTMWEGFHESKEREGRRFLQGVTTVSCIGAQTGWRCSKQEDAMQHKRMRLVKVF